MDQTDNKGNSKKVIGIIVGIAAFALSYFAVQQIFFKKAGLDKALMEAASEINKACPVMIDKDTRLDNAVAMPGNIFQYNYTLINLDKSEVNVDTVKKYIEPGLINGVRTSPEMKGFRDNKVTIAYNYRDKNGVFVIKMDVTPELYAE
ncbi:MAG: hypothetical protein HOP08_02440 [Cyclobacteriaceae bacterium]|nr:hypothetical protein [Cyclobacteriaceae bacterium]